MICKLQCFNAQDRDVEAHPRKWRVGCGHGLTTRVVTLYSIHSGATCTMFKYVGSNHWFGHDTSGLGSTHSSNESKTCFLQTPFPKLTLHSTILLVRLISAIAILYDFVQMCLCLFSNLKTTSGGHVILIGITHLNTQVALCAYKISHAIQTIFGLTSMMLCKQ